MELFKFRYVCRYLYDLCFIFLGFGSRLLLGVREYVLGVLFGKGDLFVDFREFLSGYVFFIFLGNFVSREYFIFGVRLLFLIYGF